MTSCPGFLPDGGRHTRDKCYFKGDGKLRMVDRWPRTQGMFRGIVRGLMEGKVDDLADHSMLDSIRNTAHTIEQKRRGALKSRVRVRSLGRSRMIRRRTWPSVLRDGASLIRKSGARQISARSCSCPLTTIDAA